MYTLLIMIISIIGLIVIDNVFVVIADNIVDSKIQPKIARSIFKIVLFMIIIKTVGWVSLLAFVGYSVVQYKRARIAINNIKNIVHSMLTR